ncbi:PAS domain S-box protein [Aromatoleum petrolei]|uniref:PAS domain S-box protein n=1 Tax=Aromatoleum petrolei TaxID=76116 RepID=A0ABX1MHW4_9RHOO|nr:PAS domain S-box protein [Aromatoleum petrolei]NMF87533.1 PAS domain S-box protein [Aromatoleum petrolei]QTQ38630.1 PAS domain-containing protein [Aromatoleum petrolei]
MSNDITDITRQLVEQTADSIIFADGEGRIRIWNAAAEALFGFSREEAIGQSLDLIIPERLRAAHWEGFHRAVANGRTRLGGRAVITRSLNAAGATIYVEMSFALVSDERGEVLGSVAMARDATQRREDERQLQQRIRALEEESAMRAAQPGQQST